MSIIKWNDELNIGVKLIDDQHKQLIHLINELHVAVQYGKPGEAIMPIIARLHDYANSHFAEEERLFAELEYGGVAEHRQEHLDFLARIGALSKQFSYSKDFLAIHIKDLLLNWFCNHIRSKDMEYRQLMAQPGGYRDRPAGSPAWTGKTP